MDLAHRFTVPIPVEEAWTHFNDIAHVAECFPGATVSSAEGESFSGSVKVKLGPVSTSFKADVTLTNLNPPESYTINFEGQGGIAGFAKGNSDVRLVEEGEETLLTYSIKAEVGGKLAMIGSRMIDSSSKKLAAQFFKKFNKLAAKRAAKAQSKGAVAQADDDGDE